MKQLFETPLGRLRIIGYLEGISLIILLAVAVPLKYWGANPVMVKIMGPLHGILFMWFIISTLSVGVEQRWKFSQTTWKVLIACIIPFGTFYIDRHILKQAAGQS
jgi:integral membrane protein